MPDRPTTPASHKTHVALYPGTFDPVTFGHLDVIRRARRLFDRVVVGVGRNPDKQSLFSAEERLGLVADLVHELAGEEPGEATVEVSAFDGLTVDFARRVGATVLVRGIRNLSDLQYEIQQAITNRQVASLETAFIVAEQSLAYTSSSLIRQITVMGDDLSVLAPMCPAAVIDALAEKKRRRPELLRSIEPGDG
jgi:pantetheine-phosphate adenylyltransferase